ncbi:MAG: sodium/solute symporter [Phaeodactylibacter sp.]|nr:sodium/solute symporter [Phaeodactylibacter sp.]MCB9302880.1 sodium/solute symporter [Lewinellaceae bacterium]
MKQALLYILFATFPFLFVSGNNGGPAIHFEWKGLAALPPANGAVEQPGLAGAFMGIHNNALIIAGGANFPFGPAWEGGSKVFHKDIYILQKNGKGEYTWFSSKPFSLPRKVAYGLTVSTEKGLVCIGGMDGETTFDEVFYLKWDSGLQEIEIENLPSLPVPVANMAGALIGGKIYVAASSENDNSKYFWQLDLSNPAANWETLPVWPGPARTHAVGIAQNDGETDCFYLLKGRYKDKKGPSKLYADGYSYNPVKNEWAAVGEKKGAGARQVFLSAGTALPIGANHIILFGGAEGKLLNVLEQFAIDIEAEADEIKRASLEAKRDSILKNHPGFSREIWSFHTITQTWVKVGELPEGSQVTTSAFWWDGQIVIPSGEISPCIRTPNILAGAMTDNVTFGALNYIVLLVYLLLLVGLGVVFSKNQHTTDDFFKGGNRIPWWAAGLSIFGTQLSAITFMAIPAKTFATNWLYFFLMMTIILVAPFIIRYFLPFYRRFNLTTAYEYLELRFNLLTRLIGSSMYLFLQLGRMGIVLLLPSVALSVVTGIDVHICILTMGVLSILYTVLGGIEAVIWTDVVQVAVLLGGALLSLVLLLINLDGADIVNYVSQFDKARIFDFTLDFSTPTLWVVLLGGFTTNIIQYGSDQTVIQRYLTTKDEKSAARGITTGAWLTLPATLIFFSLGTLLFVYYKVNPAMLNPTLQTADAIFPWYIVSSLPDGVVGLLIAAIFAASMSSLDSSMNSASTVVTTDFIRRLRPIKSEKTYLNLARLITLAIGVIGTGLALLMATWGISSLWDQFNMIVGLFAGGLGGIFVLGIFSKRTNGTGAIAGLIISGLVQYFIKEFTDIHLLLYAFTGMSTSIVAGYLVSLFFGKNDDENKQYTFYSLKNK